MGSAAQPQPCTGIKVVEIATMVAGPMASQMLADLGAEVIKIEAIGGDPMRHVRPMHKGMSGLFLAMNRHKKSIQLDMKSPEGLAIARRLIGEADVLIENMRPGVLDRLGLSYEALSGDNPGLIYASVSGFGPDGPYANRPAFDQVLQGLTGLMSLQNPLGEPMPVRNMFVDKYSAAATASAVTAALLYRERNDGLGQRVSVSLMDAISSLALIDNLLNMMFVEGEDRIPYINIMRPIRTADGHMIGHVQTDEQFARLCRLVDREELINDPRFVGGWNRLSNIEAMWAEIERSTRERSTKELMARVEREGIALGPINTVTEFLQDPQVRHNQSVVEVQSADYGPVLVTNYPARFVRSPANVAAVAPRLGEHTDRVLAALGFSAEQIDGARAAGYVA